MLNMDPEETKAKAEETTGFAQETLNSPLRANIDFPAGLSSSVPTGPPGITLIKKLGEGAMGEVWEARQEGLTRKVAFKILKGNASSRFQIEANAVASMRHPGIMQLFTCGVYNGRPYLVLEYVSGGDLEEKIKQTKNQPWPLEKAVALVVELAHAIHHAHGKGILHRDLKPANILFHEDGKAVIADFGLAKLLEDSSLTMNGQIMGSPAWIPPEQAAGDLDNIGPASDTFGLGAVLYQLLTGKAPFHMPSTFQALIKAREADVDSPRKLNPLIPVDLEKLLLKALAKNPKDRFSSAEDFARQLEHWLNRKKRRNLLIGSATAFVAILGLLALAFFKGGSNNPIEVVAELTCEKFEIFVRPGEGVEKASWLKLPSAGTLPAKPGDLMFVEAKFNQPAYIYLFFVQANGKVKPLYPWSLDGTGLGKITMNDIPNHPGPSKELSWPPLGVKDGSPTRKAIRFDASPGLETILLLASKDPWPAGKTPAEILGDKPLPPRMLGSNLSEYITIGADQSQPVQILLQENSRGIDDGLAEIKDPVESLLNKVANDFPVRRITWFGHVGN